MGSVLLRLGFKGSVGWGEVSSVGCRVWEFGSIGFVLVLVVVVVVALLASLSIV